MTQDEIIQMAKEANIQDAYSRSPHKGVIAQLEAFAKLIAAKEREACAKVIENYPHWIGKSAKTEISNAIRAREKQA